MGLGLRVAGSGAGALTAAIAARRSGGLSWKGFLWEVVVGLEVVGLWVRVGGKRAGW